MKFSSLILWIFGIYLIYYFVVIVLDVLSRKKKLINEDELSFSFADTKDNISDDSEDPDIVNEDDFISEKKKLINLSDIEIPVESQGIRAEDFCKAMREASFEAKNLFAGVRGL